MKKCTKCKTYKSKDNFFKDKNKDDNLTCTCKECYAKYLINYQRTFRGFITTIYASQKESSKKRNYPLPTYTKKEFEEWIKEQPYFEYLFKCWVESGYKKGLKPSVDRLDEYKSYTFDNIQLVTWKENHKNQQIRKKNGENNKVSRPVIMFDMDNNILNEYYSLSEASRDNNISKFSIWGVCNNKAKHTHRYIFKYKD